MGAPELEVVKEVVEEKNAKPGIFIKFIVLVLVPFLYTIGLVMLLLHFAGVNIQTQVKMVENVAKPLVTLFDAPKKTAPSTEKKEITSETTTGTKTNDKEVPYSSSSNTGSNSSTNNKPLSPTTDVTETGSNATSSVDIYANLKPEQIAIIFKGIKDRDEVLRQFQKLDSKTASKVIVLLDPDTAGWLITQMD